MKNLLLHIPHSSTVIPFLEGYCVSEEVLQQEILKLTDWYTDDLFENQTDASIKATFSRIFCDTERFSDDSQEIMAQFGMGALYTKTDNGNIMRNVTETLRTKILKEYYWKHHNYFTKTVKTQLEKWGTATIVDCHSFPSKPIVRDLIQATDRPDFNIGTDSYHTPKKLIEASKDFFQQKGFSLGIDQPYAGSIVPMAFYKKDKNVQSIMLEINRKLYLNEPTNEKSAEYQATKKITQEFLSVVRDL